jgi:hypothetical protein
MAYSIVFDKFLNIRFYCALAYENSGDNFGGTEESGLPKKTNPLLEDFLDFHRCIIIV